MLKDLTPADRARYFRLRRYAAAHHIKAHEWSACGRDDMAEVYRGARDDCARLSISELETPNERTKGNE